MAADLGFIGPDAELLQAVVRLGRANKKYLGFLPDQGFVDRAVNGTLLVAHDGDALAGYLLFDLPSDSVKIRHLCVAPGQRGQGVARALVSEVSRVHKDRTALELACRRDFPAASLWPKLDFAPVGERPGRSRQRHPLVLWRYDHGHPTLFSNEPAEREIAVIDHNVLIDLATGRRQGAESRKLDNDWVAEEIELCLTNESSHEIEACDDEPMRKRLYAFSHGLRNISRADSDWTSLKGLAAEAAPRAGKADHRHVARATAAGATYFVTRDEKLLKGAAQIQTSLELVVIRPEDLIHALDHARSHGHYEPQALMGTSITQVPPADVDQSDLVAAFLNNGAGERKVELNRTIRTAFAAPREHTLKVFLSDKSRPVAAVAYAKPGATLQVSLLRVNSSGPLGDAIARQLAFLTRKDAADAGLTGVVITDGHPSPSVLRAFEAEAFTRDADGLWTCAVETGLAEVDDPDLGAGYAAQAERQRWPVKIIGAGLPTFMVSIKPAWAEQLFDEALAAATLFGRADHLGLSREHVYYRSPGAPGGIRSPARLLWYVKGGAPGHPQGHVRAVSLLQEIVVGPPNSLFRRFERLGAWTYQQVADAANAKGEVMALRFTDTEVFQSPLALPALRDAYSQLGQQFLAPQGPRRVSEDAFCLLYAQASRYVG